MALRISTRKLGLDLGTGPSEDQRKAALLLEEQQEELMIPSFCLIPLWSHTKQYGLYLLSQLGDGHTMGFFFF